MLLNIRVKTNSKIDSATKDSEGNIIIKIREKPVDGKANKCLVEYLAEIFDISKSKIEITKGFNIPHKTVLIDADEMHVRKITSTFKSK